ncbi:MAG: TetR/AcrR family transcriptional regulator [Gammaproteobacteria bacterium]|nr:TetR/AcrR family transcriptional regulator [Gammaproteobacteria bacterium]
MGTKGSANRQRIVDAADHLFYSRGYNQTSFSDISEQTGIPRGNFYYYFKTKEDILEAVIDARVNEYQKMLVECDQATDEPEARLEQFVQMPMMHEEKILKYGCPLGTLGSELIKDQDQVILQDRLTAVFDLLLEWCTTQFKALGFEHKAHDLAMDLLAKLQGIAVLSNIYNDRTFLHRSTADVQQWLKQLTASSHAETL